MVRKSGKLSFSGRFMGYSRQCIILRPALCMTNMILRYAEPALRYSATPCRFWVLPSLPIICFWPYAENRTINSPTRNWKLLQGRVRIVSPSPFRGHTKSRKSPPLSTYSVSPVLSFPSVIMLSIRRTDVSLIPELQFDQEHRHTSSPDERSRDGETLVVKRVVCRWPEERKTHIRKRGFLRSIQMSVQATIDQASRNLD